MIHGALNPATGEGLHLARKRNRQDGAAAFVAAADRIEIARLPVRSPALNPCEDL